MYIKNSKENTLQVATILMIMSVRFVGHKKGPEAVLCGPFHNL